MSKALFALILILDWSFLNILLADQNVVAVKVKKSPRVDGIGDDAVWTKAKEVTTYNQNDKVKFRLRAVYTNTHIYFLAKYEDKDESRTHKTWVWNKKDEIYEIGNDREDAMVFKWNLGSPKIDLRLSTGQPHEADIWFWKANRTDPVSFADDKKQIYTTQKIKKSDVTDISGRTMYLLRLGDEGQSSYKPDVPSEFQGPKLLNFKNRVPTASRADVIAKGNWQNGTWTIEFGRKLDTGHVDDIQFTDLKKRYHFGVSRNEIAGRKVNPKLSNPYYGTGDVDESLYLTF